MGLLSVRNIDDIVDATNKRNAYILRSENFSLNVYVIYLNNVHTDKFFSFTYVNSRIINVM